MRVEWLGQVIDSVPMKDRAIPALTTVRGYAKALADLRTAIERVQSHAQEPALATLFRLEGPLAAYLSRLYAWTEEISSELEALAVGLRRDEPVWTVFSHRAVTGSFEHFNDLSEAVRKKVASTTAPPGKLEPFSAHLEELFWATEWLHLSLAKAPGQ